MLWGVSSADGQLWDNNAPRQYACSSGVTWWPCCHERTRVPCSQAMYITLKAWPDGRLSNPVQSANAAASTPCLPPTHRLSTYLPQLPCSDTDTHTAAAAAVSSHESLTRHTICSLMPVLWCPLLLHRRPYERLLRKVLSLPNHPAVILLHAYAWLKPDPHMGNFYNNAERDFNEMAEYYGLPAVSVKSCCYEAMRNAEPGFQVCVLAVGSSTLLVSLWHFNSLTVHAAPDPANEHKHTRAGSKQLCCGVHAYVAVQVHAARERNKLDYKGLVFYYDNIHPDGVTGHRCEKNGEGKGGEAARHCVVL